MTKRLLISALVLLAAAATLNEVASAREPGYVARQRAAQRVWHGRYNHVEYNTPIALVVPPTATLQTDWGWGVGNTRVTRIDHQFMRPWPGQYDSGRGFRHTPRWPSDTRQFGVYSVRAPW